MFNKIFSELLQKRGISSYRLTKDTGISNGMISKWKNGTQIPSADNLSKLSDYFGVSVDYLLGRDAAVDSPSDQRGQLDSFFSKIDLQAAIQQDSARTYAINGAQGKASATVVSSSPEMNHLLIGNGEADSLSESEYIALKSVLTAMRSKKE